MYPFGHGKQVFRFGGKGKGMHTKKWQIHQLNFTHKKRPFWPLESYELRALSYGLKKHGSTIIYAFKRKNPTRSRLIAQSPQLIRVIS